MRARAAGTLAFALAVLTASTLLAACDHGRSSPPATPSSALLCAAARELLCNARKHAQASRVRVRLSTTARRATLSVSDNGIGSATDVRSRIDGGAGFGPRNLRLRLNERRGTMSVSKAKPGGIRVVCAIPLGAKSS